MGDSLDVSVISYRDEVIVEILTTDEYGQPDAITYQFAFDDGPRTLVPKQSIDSEHVGDIKQELTSKGYQMNFDEAKIN